MHVYISCLVFAFWSWWQEWGEAQSGKTRQTTTQFPARSRERPIWCVGCQCRGPTVLQVGCFAQVSYVYDVHHVYDVHYVYIPTRAGIQYHDVVTVTCVMGTLTATCVMGTLTAACVMSSYIHMCHEHTNPPGFSHRLLSLLCAPSPSPFLSFTF